MKIKDKEQQIEHIIDNFDFSKVRRTMKNEYWEWAEVDVPSLIHIIEEATRLLNDVKNNSILATGGFKASCRDGIYQLEFILAEYDSEFYKDK